MSQKSFFEKLNAAIERNNTLLCVGLDPRPERLNAVPGASDEEKLAAWGQKIIDQTKDLVCCYKPNFAFYEQYGPEGLNALRRTIAAVPEEIPVLLDAKRGDIGSTAEAYARAAFEIWGADAITLSPYLGKDSVVPFLKYEGKAVFLLCHTSNPSAGEIQHFGTKPLYQHIAETSQSWDDASRIAFVVGATQPEALAAVRPLVPESWILAPGVGAQGGNLKIALQAGLNEQGTGMIIPVSRAVIFADDPRQAAVALRDQINKERAALNSQPAKTAETNWKEQLAAGLYAAGCVKLGDFTLASGKKSPIYIDLRRIISFPDLFKQVVNAYARLVKPIGYDHLAAVPYAALPTTTALSLQFNKSLIYPRKQVKQHGTGQKIEGVFEAGQTALLIEDVVTSGKSIIAALEPLRSAGLTASDVIVLVDRNQGGRERLAEVDCRLHAVLTIDEIFDLLYQQELITPEMYQTAVDYLEANHA